MDQPNKTPSQNPSKAQTMPVLFVGYGSPLNAMENKPWSRTWRELGKKPPKPRTILCISAHWETTGTWVAVMDQSGTLHDFSGFPQELFSVKYPAPGSTWLAEAEIQAVRRIVIGP